MKPRHASIIALLLGLLTLCTCNPDRQAECLLPQADSLIEAHPDSALRLLRTLPATRKLSRRECARYALLLARATDKSGESLLPCDSLLDLALDYYSSNKKERAVALLYKGRLEQEMTQTERSINLFLEGLKVIKQFPDEFETKRHLLSSLGNEYHAAQLYSEAGKAYKEMLNCCFTDKDKAIALNSLASYYSMTDQKDSTLLMQHKALEYARASGDSGVIAIAMHHLSIFYHNNENPDSALHYAKMALQRIPASRNKANYYNNIGRIYYAQEENDSALYYTTKALQESEVGNIGVKTAALINLSYIKEDQKDYQATSDLLYQYIDIIDSLFYSEQYTQILQTIHKHDIETKIKEEQVKETTRLTVVMSTSMSIFLIVVLFYQHRINRRKKQQNIQEQQLQSIQERFNILQNTTEENQHVIALLQKEQNLLVAEKENILLDIQERETIIKRLEDEKLALRDWLFKQSSIYKKVMRLSEQVTVDKKQMKVLNITEQKELDATISSIYAEYMAKTKEKYPLLTQEDLLYLCLEENGLSTQSISLCFGKADTHALAQRKYRLKQRMQEAE